MESLWQLTADFRKLGVFNLQLCLLGALLLTHSKFLRRQWFLHSQRTRGFACFLKILSKTNDIFWIVNRDVTVDVDKIIWLMLLFIFIISISRLLASKVNNVKFSNIQVCAVVEFASWGYRESWRQKRVLSRRLKSYLLPGVTLAYVTDYVIVSAWVMCRSWSSLFSSRKLYALTL